MKQVRTLLLAGALMTLAGSAHASLVQWQFNGTFTSVDPGLYAPWSPPSSEIAAGKPFSILASFDSDAVLIQKRLDLTDGSGYRYLFDNTTLKFKITAGSFTSGSLGGGASQNIIVRDGFPLVAGDSASSQVDGITLPVFFPFDDKVDGTDIDGTFSIILRNLDLGALTVTNDKMPTIPMAIVPNMQANFFQYCRSTHGTNDCNWGSVNGEFTSVAAVPEPSTYALMLAGLAIVGGVTRRRRS